ncbi:MAG: hypothetical protein ACRC42_01940, partial [Mycoplasma sp.]
MELTFTEIGDYKILTLTPKTATDTFTINISATQTIAVVASDYTVTNGAYFSNNSCTTSIGSDDTLLDNKAYIKLAISPNIASGELGGTCEPTCNVTPKTISDSGEVCLELRFTASGTYKIKTLTLTGKTFDISAIASNTIVVFFYAATNAEYYTNSDCSTPKTGDIKIKDKSAEAYVKVTISPAFKTAGQQLKGECKTGCTFTPVAVTASTTACTKLTFNAKGTYFITKLNLDGET